MRRIEDECFGCSTESYPCIGSSCNLKNVVHYYCDICGYDIDPQDGVFEVDGKDLCIECLKEKYRKDFE